MGIWDQMTPYHTVGLAGATPPSSAGTMPGVGRSAGPGQLSPGGTSPFHPDSPLFWFAGLAAVTLGLVAVSTSVRVGPIRAAVGAGKK